MKKIKGREQTEKTEFNYKITLKNIDIVHKNIR